ncbi:hypothetical protein GGF31_008597 [Allomyces arbusculus]|nr:hypothetical protein GGF31_008597 [Allomyces arbusculus]
MPFRLRPRRKRNLSPPPFAPETMNFQDALQLPASRRHAASVVAARQQRAAALPAVRDVTQVQRPPDLPDGDLPPPHRADKTIATPPDSAFASPSTSVPHSRSATAAYTVGSMPTQPHLHSQSSITSTAVTPTKHSPDTSVATAPTTQHSRDTTAATAATPNGVPDVVPAVAVQPPTPVPIASGAPSTVAPSVSEQHEGGVAHQVTETTSQHVHEFMEVVKHASAELATSMRQSIYTMAAARVDTLEDEQFEWSRMKQNLERVWVAAQPLPEFFLFLRGVFMWESPLKTAFFMAIYFSAAFLGIAMPTAFVVLVITFAFYGISHERALDAVGLRCLYVDAQAQPRFADASRAKHLQERYGKAQSPTPGATEAPATEAGATLPSQLNLPSTVRGLAAAAARPDDVWRQIKEEVLAYVQLELRDAADILEKLHNCVTWKRPWATLSLLVGVALSLSTVTYVLTPGTVMRIVATVIGLLLFVLLPLQMKFPRYRRMFSVTHLILWPFPTHAEWSIEQLARATKPIETCTDDVCLTTIDEVRNFSCMYRGTTGILRIDPSSPTIVFRATGTVFGRPGIDGVGPMGQDAAAGTLEIAHQDIVRMKKNTHRHHLFFKNHQIVLYLRDGGLAVFDHVNARDDAFSLLAAVSSDPKRKWRIPGI